MKKFRPVLLVAVGLIAGLAAGWFISARFYNRWIETFMISDQFAGVSDNFSVLKALRSGNTNEAIEELERQMDRHLIGLGAMIGDVPPDRRRSADIRLLTRVGEYRAAYPRTTDSADIDGYVAEAFSLTNAQSQKP